MIVHPAVREFVDDDVLEELCWHEEERRIDHDDSLSRATAPLRSCETATNARDPLIVGMRVDPTDQCCNAALFGFGYAGPE